MYFTCVGTTIDYVKFYFLKKDSPIYNKFLTPMDTVMSLTVGQICTGRDPRRGVS